MAIMTPDQRNGVGYGGSSLTATISPRGLKDPSPNLGGRGSVRFVASKSAMVPGVKPNTSSRDGLTMTTSSTIISTPCGVEFVTGQVTLCTLMHGRVALISLEPCRNWLPAKKWRHG